MNPARSTGIEVDGHPTIKKLSVEKTSQEIATFLIPEGLPRGKSSEALILNVKINSFAIPRRLYYEIYCFYTS
jgi:hypothetical protein